MTKTRTILIAKEIENSRVHVVVFEVCRISMKTIIFV